MREPATAPNTSRPSANRTSGAQRRSGHRIQASRFIGRDGITADMADTEAPEPTAARRPRHPGLRVLGAGAPALLLVAVSLWEIVAVARSARRAPAPADWSALSAELHRRHHSGELIVFAPAWIDPIGRREVGDLISIEMAGRMDAARYAVAWEVSQGGARARETEGARRTWSQDFGRLTLSRWERTPADVATDFVAA